MKHVQADKSFLGRGWGFPPRFDARSKSVQMVANEADIKESLRILIATRPGERIMQPAYGCSLHALVFEGVNESTIAEIEEAIDQAILFFEPRIGLERVDVDTQQAYDGLLKIRIEYTVRETNTRSNIVYPFYFQEGTNVRM